ncbi:MAG: SMC family ATPase [Microbacteriaceae bacterium]|nr:SMC family ATPase [Microbacteriaceae bacterium]
MRIRTVTIEGFGPFKHRQHVDFSAFDADGLFLIAGQTGVGKSSILDAIAYALYNKTPRWDNVSATGASNAVRSDFCGVDDPTQVIVEFETNGNEYRVSRSPEYDRPKARGEGTTKQSAKILVEALEHGVWVGKATKEREAAELIEGLIKLNKDEFLQVIMLAQGRFQEFLLANSEQRLDLLSKLFGTGRFADYQARVAQRRSALSKKVELAREQRTMLLGGIEAPEEIGEAPPDDELDWLDRVIASAAETAGRAARAVTAAEKAEKAALDRLEVARKQARAEAAKQALVALEARREEIEQAKAALHRAGRAERVRPVLDDARDRLAAWERATSDADDARRGYDGDVADDALAAEVSRLTEETGTLTEAVQDEQRADQLERDHAAQKDLADGLVVALAKTTESIKSLQVERAELAPIAAQSKPAHDEVGRAKDRLAAATKAADIAGQLSTAQEAQLAADRRVTAARAVADDVFERFLHGQAAVLATQLVAGGPCAVCGSTEHPSPASFTGEPVAQDDVDDARAEVARLEPEANTAKERVEALKVAAAGLVGAAGDGDVDTLTAAVARAQAELRSATDAEQRIGEIDEDLNGDEGLLAEQKRLEAAGKDAAAEVTKLKTERDSLAAKVARLRGDHPTVKARHEALVAEREAAKRLADAVAALGTATKQHVDADARLATKLAQEKFESAEDLEEALLGEAELGELTERIETHAAAVSENQGILKQPDLQGLPDEIIAVDDASTAHGDAQRATRAATTERANSESALTQLESKRKDLAALLAETEDLVARYDVLHRLSETVHGRTPNTKGMSLESYYIAAELEDVLAAANARLRTLSQGRFELRHTERGVRRANASAGLEIEVFDEFTGTARPANQLSGGQQFLASLALALGLAEVVTSRAGGIELNTLFVDEGFGSLSTEYLEIAMETLDSLKQGGRTVGVISHVSSMQEQIAAQLRVVAEPGGPSEILQDLPGTPAGVPRQRRRADDRAETRA